MTAMARETAEAPAAVARQLAQNAAEIRGLAVRLKQRPPPFVITAARGSSDHAANYLKYLVEILLGIPCCSMGASVVSVYQAPLKARDAVVFTISQSGRSPDILALQSAARAAGALTVAIVNDETSPVAREADVCLPLHAGPERSVAATKSFITSLTAAASLAGQWADIPALERAVHSLPEILEKAAQIRWTAAETVLVKAQSMFAIGRGPAFPIAQEAALKLKETSGLHAEAYSTAEVLHGPMELLSEAFPLLVFSPNDQSRQTTLESMDRLRRTGTQVLAVEPGDDLAGRLSYPETGHPYADPICMIQIFYSLAEAVARARGHDPDHPRWLSKITETT